ncbi:glycosyl transferase family 2 [uncultured Bacteroides sp.]|uniref:glycosyl transferase family 2 n=1 Tax=uncultured Bacteroides sp. TaxID=162156 RepID=UPI0025EE4B2E|nr:glycosyl transferase family 2 [uncultured Bacteroides sp.]
MRLLAVVVLYHPGEDLVGNINSCLPQVDKLLLWDNTPADAAGRISLAGVCHPERLEYRGCGRNVGIGAALNDAVAYAREHGYTHLLTLDQDSFFLDGDFGRYRKSIQDYGEDRRVIFSVNYFIKSQRSSLYPVTDTIDEVSSAMTSGTVYPVGLFAELGVFMDELFVWGIDCEYCWRAARKGVRTVCFKNILLQHDLGYQKKKHRLLGKEVFPNEYPPARTYYNVRNGIILHRLYPEKLNLKAHLRYHLYKRMVFVLLYEQQKIAKWKALWDGFRDGKRGRLGKRA